MKALYLDHFNIKAPKGRLHEVKNFYVEVLGLSEGFRPRLGSPGQWLYAGDNAILHLSEDEGRVAQEKENFMDHIAIRCEGLNEFAKKLTALSIAYKVAAVPEIDLTQIFFKDPAGITIEINFQGETLRRT